VRITAVMISAISPSILALARIGIAAMVAGWLRSMRTQQQHDAEWTAIRQFRELIASLNEEELRQFYDSYQMLTGLEANQQFRRKRDACLAEMNRRAHVSDRRVAWL
jgi:hypothetical protein